MIILIPCVFHLFSFLFLFVLKLINEIIHLIFKFLHANYESLHAFLFVRQLYLKLLLSLHEFFLVAYYHQLVIIVCDIIPLLYFQIQSSSEGFHLFLNLLWFFLLFSLILLFIQNKNLILIILLNKIHFLEVLHHDSSSFSYFLLLLFFRRNFKVFQQQKVPYPGVFYFEKINFINHFIILLMEPLKNFQANSFFYVVIDLKYYYAN